MAAPVKRVAGTPSDYERRRERHPLVPTWFLIEDLFHEPLPLAHREPV